jgi:F0F1-type ATP synthase delta subunit
MRYSPRLFQAWVDPLRNLQGEDERLVAFQLVTLDRAIRTQPALLRRLADRSIASEVRLGWFATALTVSKDSPLLHTLEKMLAQNALNAWPTFFHEYLRFRERRGFGRLYLVKSHTTLSSEEQTQVQTYLEAHFSQPATLYPVVDPTVKAGMRIESFDGWVLDATLAGRLNRLVSSLA